MAKISTGPLAAGLSGKLGPVVFHQTRFGQVVQSKAKGKTYTTPAAMATKRAFRAGATSYGLLGSLVNLRANKAYGSAGKSGAAQWNTLIMQAVLSGTGRTRPHIGAIPYYEANSLTASGPWQWLFYRKQLTGGDFDLHRVVWIQLDSNFKAIRILQSQFPALPLNPAAPNGTISPPFVVAGLAVDFDFPMDFGKPAGAQFYGAFSVLV